MFGILAQSQKDVRAAAGAWMSQVDSSIIHPLALVVFIIAALWIFFGPRGKVVWSVLLIACFISVAQRFAVLTMDFHFARAIGTLGLIRILFYGELRTLKPNITDKLMVAFVAVPIVMIILREGVSGGVSRAGASLDIFGMYWIGRASLTTTKDIRMMMAALGVIAIPLSAFFVIEQTTGRNLFSIFGGVSEFTAIRDGKLRAQGSFCHPIIAGVFFASFFPIAIGVIRSRIRGIASLLGGWATVVLSIMIILMCNSSTPVAGILIGLMAWATFRFRQYLKTWLYAILVLMILAHFASTNGVHNLIFTRIDFTGSSTGYHRYLLVDGLINNVSKWMFIGDSYPAYNRSYRDITNMYVGSALAGGAITLGLLFCIVYQAFKASLRGVRNATNREEIMMMYGMGCAYAAMAVSFTAVACYGEGLVPFYMLIGGGITVSQTLFAKRHVREDVQRPAGQSPPARQNPRQLPISET